MTQNVALMGLAGSGKDTAAGLLAERHGHVRVAFADSLKRMALAVDPIVYAYDSGNYEGTPVHLSDIVAEQGWDSAKRNFAEVRRFLQRLGSEGVRDTLGANTWVDIAHRAVRAAWLEQRPVALTDVRFPNEVAYARRYGFRVVWLHRPEAGEPMRHASETSVGPADADLIVRNDGTLEGLAFALSVLVD